MEEDLRAEEDDRRADGDEWKSLSRVSNIPLVNTALRAYEQSKASSRVVKVCPLYTISRTMLHERIVRR